MKFAVLALILFPIVSRAADVDLIVSARILDTGTLTDGREACRVGVSVINQAQHPVTIYMMTCGWDASWLIDSLWNLEIAGWGCDKNLPAAYVFPPGRGYSFLFAVRARERGAHLEGATLKLGYICIESKPRFETLWSDMEVSHGRMAWSNQLSVPMISNHVLSYDGERRELPNQLPDPNSPSVMSPAGAGVAPSVAAGH